MTSKWVSLLFPASSLYEGSKFKNSMTEWITRCQTQWDPAPPSPPYLCGKGEENESHLHLILTLCVSFLHLPALMGRDSTFHLALALSSFVNSFGLLCWLVLWLLWLPAPADALSWVPVGQALLLSAVAVSRALFLRLPTGRICAVGPSGQDL